MKEIDTKQTLDKKRNPSASVVFKSSIWYTVSNFLTRALVFITTPVFSRILTTDQFGKFYVFADWQNTLMIITGLEVYATLNRARFDFTDKKSLDSYISTCLSVSAGMTCCLLAIYFLFSTPVENLLLMDRSYIALMFAYLFARPAFEMFQAEQRVLYQYKLSAGISFFMVVFTSLLALFLAYRMSDDRLLGRVVGQYIPYVLLGLFFYFYYFLRSRSLSLEKARYAVILAVPLVFSYLGGQILLSSTKIIVQHLCSAEAVAYLAIATSCSHIMLIFVQSLNNAWSPFFYDKLAIEDYSAIRKTFRYYFWFVIICTLGSLLLGPELVLLLGGPKYEPAVALLPPIMLSGVFTLIVSQFGAFETYCKKAYYAAIITSIVAIINIVFVLAGVRIFGYIAAGYAMVISYLFLIGFHLIATKKMGFLTVFSFKEVIFAIIVVLGIIPLALLVYQNSFIRYSVLCIFVLLFIFVLFYYRKKLFLLLKGKDMK